MYKVKVISPVYFDDKRHEIDEVIVVDKKIMNEDVFKILEEIEEEVEEENLEDLTVAELKEIAKEKEIESYSTMKKEELIKAIKEIEGE